MKHTYIIPCRPRSKERPRFGNGRTFHSKQYRSWQDEFRQALVGRYGVPLPFDGPIKVSMVFRFPTKGRSDLDNLYAGCVDALQPPGAKGKQGDPQHFPGVLWLDDSQIVGGSFDWEPSWEKVVELTVEEVETPAVPPKPRKKRGAA